MFLLSILIWACNIKKQKPLEIIHCGIVVQWPTSSNQQEQFWSASICIMMLFYFAFLFLFSIFSWWFLLPKLSWFLVIFELVYLIVQSIRLEYFSNKFLCNLNVTHYNFASTCHSKSISYYTLQQKPRNSQTVYQPPKTFLWQMICPFSFC